MFNRIDFKISYTPSCTSNSICEGKKIEFESNVSPWVEAHIVARQTIGTSNSKQLRLVVLCQSLVAAAAEDS